MWSRSDDAADRPLSKQPCGTFVVTSQAASLDFSVGYSPGNCRALRPPKLALRGGSFVILLRLGCGEPLLFGCGNLLVVTELHRE